MSSNTALEIALRGGFNFHQHEQLVTLLAPLRELDQPRSITMDLSGLVHVCPLCLTTIVAAIIDCRSRHLVAPGSRYVEPANRLVRRQIEQLGLSSQLLSEGSVATGNLGRCQRFSRNEHLHDAALTLMQANRTAMGSRWPTAPVAIYLAVLGMAQNVLDHAHGGRSERSPTGFALGHHLRRAHAFEVAIVDDGIGIPTSLRESTSSHRTLSDLQAIERALQEGVTSRPDAAHHGLLLSTVERAVLDNGGAFLVRSGSALLERGGHGRRLDDLRPHRGTTIAFRLDTRLPFTLDRFQELMEPRAAVAVAA